MDRTASRAVPAMAVRLKVKFRADGETPLQALLPVDPPPNAASTNNTAHHTEAAAGGRCHCFKVRHSLASYPDFAALSLDETLHAVILGM